MKRYIILASALLLALGVQAQSTYYVHKGSGKNSNAGSKDAPFKNIAKALAIAKAGDKIYVAEGNYFGLRDIGCLEMKEPVELYGGYSADFSSRDILKHKTLVMPTNESNCTGGNKPSLELALAGKKGKVVIDGILFDKGESNSYHPSDAKPKGVSTGRLTKAPAKGNDKCVTADIAIIKGNTQGDVTIQNCLFNNGPNMAIQVGIDAGGSMRVLNNVFTAISMTSVEVWGRGRGNDSKIEIAYNTFLFSWTRTKTLEDMGYSVRPMTRIHSNIHHNVFGCALQGAIAKTKIDAPKSLEDAREVRIDHNRFFLNKGKDLVLPSKGALFDNVKVDDFEDVEMTSIQGNEELKDLQGLKKAINQPYLEGFLSLTHSEKTDYDPNSSANQFRSAMGMNQVGSITTKVSMFANRYPQEDALRLFGAVKGFGAQIPK